jgi:hypothetical protein
MTFSLYITRNANRKFIMFSIPLMQFIGALATEITNVLAICRYKSYWDIIINVVVFIFISQIDEFVFMLQQNTLGKGLLKEGVTLNFQKRTARELLDVNQSWFYWCLTILFLVLLAMYESIYFYFMPYLSIPLSL